MNVSTKSTTIAVKPLPVATVAPEFDSICTGESTTLTASGGTSYIWSTGAVTPSIVVSPTATTTYIVSVSNADGCR